MKPVGRRLREWRAGPCRLARRLLPLILAGWLVAPIPALGASDVLEATEALARAGAGGLVIVDVRTTAEWAETGVPQGAVEVSLLPQRGTPNANFVEDILAAVGRDRDTPIALICATGNRSAYARNLLRKNGFTEVYSISEGMAGSTYGPGWLARGLPVERCGSC